MNFPTKVHWRSPSKPEYIEAGLKKFVLSYADKGFTSIAFPMLGCGNGELSWESEVRPLMEKYLNSVPIDVFVHINRGDFKIAEHGDAISIKRWLRSEPGSLSFIEVWDDLLSVLRHKRQFKTLEYEEKFSAQILKTPEDGVLFVHNGIHYQVPKEDLLTMWQQIRDVGFYLKEMMSGEQYQAASYVMALFSQLSYLEPILINNNYEQLNEKSIGLRLWPVNSLTQSNECIYGDKQYELAF